MEKKYSIAIILIFIANTVPSLLSETARCSDIYLFEDICRPWKYIAWDLSVMLEFSILAYFLIPLSEKVFKPLFLLSVLGFIFYFLVFTSIGGVTALAIYYLIYILHYYHDKHKD